ncbi:class I adenylate-forming enzyme family protein [Paenibacillus hexagrammi]|uniref:Acyl--CoA ligase n=1 Tax=Paenibacillus hexagrammi TaxID=2908839 RepID=A0ABY3SNC9_9BACL|nr:class I adenylate-forming enzyme family protein [Paenibacillus sp. YPD9-1]UJF34497.1 acyl--CoA ligase [Paenibacillus sp. YPD9-1]
MSHRLSLWGLMEAAFHKHAARPALSYSDGTTLRYGEMGAYVRSLADQLREQLPFGARVAILENRPVDEACLVLACLSLNMVIVPLAAKYGEARCVQIIQQTRPHVLVTLSEHGLGAGLQAACAEAGTKVVVPALARQEEYDANRAEVSMHRESLSSGETLSRTTPAEAHTEDAEAQLSDMPQVPPSFIMYTSGSTGQPKGAVLTYDNIQSNMEDIQQYFELNADDHILINRSLSHASVLTGEFLLGCACGAQMTFYDEPFVPRRLASFMEQRHITVFCSTPTIFYQMAMDKVERRLPELRKVALMGEYLHKQVALTISEKYRHVQFYMLYGQTEASPRVTYLPPEHFGWKESCIGSPMVSMQADVVDDLGRSCRTGEDGELILKGPNIFWGYWNNPELTERKLRDGWLYTGDMVRRGEDGYLYIIGRKDDMIIRAGMNIYPKEIEDVLLEDRRIKQAVAYGVPDPRYGQKIHISVVSHSELEEPLSVMEIMEICKGRLASYQLPDIIRIVDEIPRNAAGKIVRRQIIEDRTTNLNLKECY